MGATTAIADMHTASSRFAHARALEAIVRDVARDTILPHYLHAERSHKHDGSTVTTADLASQKHFMRELPQLLPGPVLGEEMPLSHQQDVWRDGQDGLWCIDPIDGTTNFASGIPFFAVSIAYLVGHRSQFGVVYNPVTDECFYAARGCGAYLNGHRLPLREPASSLAASIAGIDFKRVSPALSNLLTAEPPYFSQRNFGSSALEWCFVAAGRLDIYLHGGQMLWDYAAGQLILSEAGGQGGALDGQLLMQSPSEKRAVLAASSAGLFSQWHAWLTAHKH